MPTPVPVRTVHPVPAGQPWPVLGPAKFGNRCIALAVVRVSKVVLPPHRSQCEVTVTAL